MGIEVRREPLVLTVTPRDPDQDLLNKLDRRERNSEVLSMVRRLGITAPESADGCDRQQGPEAVLLAAVTAGPDGMHGYWSTRAGVAIG